MVQAAILTWRRLLQYAVQTPPVSLAVMPHGSRADTAATTHGSYATAASTPSGMIAAPSLTSNERASAAVLQSVLRLLMGHPDKDGRVNGPWPQLMSQASDGASHPLIQSSYKPLPPEPHCVL